MEKYIIGIDQSTQGTKALLFSQEGNVLMRTDLSHRQIIDQRGWVEHDPEEILENTAKVVKLLLERSGVDGCSIEGIGISNQRETGVVWNRETGKPLNNAIVWQCGRAREICDRIKKQGYAPMVKERTGINLSPYFTAGKIAWVLENVPEAKRLSGTGKLGCGTMDSWLVNRLTDGESYKTDYSNASRTQMFNIETLQWDPQVCELFGIDTADLAQVCDSNVCYGYTDLLGVLPRKVPIHCVMGDSHGALYGQGCHKEGMIKTTYGTGSSVMMNIGSKIKRSDNIVTSIAWGLNGKVDYVLEGNLNYTGATITWLKDDLNLITSSKEVCALSQAANPRDETYLVPAFSGMGAPYWDSEARAVLVGMSRSTRKNEIVKAAEESIAYQIADVVMMMEEDSGIPILQLKVDGGPTRDAYLMQFQSDILRKEVIVPSGEELSCIGVGYCAGVTMGLFPPDVFTGMACTVYAPQMEEHTRFRKYAGWRAAVAKSLSKH